MSKSTEKRKNKRRINVEERKLGKEKAVGLAHYDFYGKNLNLIEIDPRQCSKDYLDTLIHEALHIMFPDWTEKEIVEHSGRLARLIWRQGYRRIKD